jgi:integrase|tara:strand:+ start:460 stop:1665 length:1206 start_codon:yes stop_codon:yes gene_type:complete
MGRRKETKFPKGITAHGGVIRIFFSYQGRSYRKSTGLPPTPDNLILVNAILTQMRAQKALGTLNIEEHFPSKATKEIKHLTSTRLGELVKEECDRKLKIGTWGLSTYDRRIDTLNKHFLPSFGMLTLLELTPAHVRNWLKTQTFSSAYATQVLGLMRFLFTAAVGDGIIDRHPFDHIKPGDYLKTVSTNQRMQRINPLSFDEVERVLNASPDHERAFWGVGFYTGIRLQELLALRWEDVDFNNDVIHIQRAVKRRATDEEYVGETKNDGSDRIIEVDPEVMRHLRYHRKFTQLEGTFVFKPTTSNRRSVNARDRYGFNQVKTMWPAALKRADVSLTNRSAKQIRHTFASIMLSEGMSPMQVSTCMGHASLTMLEKHYAKAIIQGKKKRRSLDIGSMRGASN